MRFVAWMVFGALTFFGCVQGGGPTPGTRVPATADEGPKGHKRMAHCPSAVPGARTRITDVPGGASIEVTAGNWEAVQEIRRRAAFLSALSARQVSSEVRHTGRGQGGGDQGGCPVVGKNTGMVSEDIEGGARILVSSPDPAELRRMARSRLEALPARLAVYKGRGRL